MFRKIDLYIAKKFLGTFMFMIMVVMSIAIVIDISERLKEFTNPESELTFIKITLEYYPYFFIHYVNLFSSLIIFLAVIFFTSVMAQRSEIIAILSNGISFRRFTRPYLIVSTILLAFSLIANHSLVPHANKKRIAFENTYIWTTGVLEDVNLQIDDSTIVHYSSYVPNENTVYRLWIENWKKNDDGLLVMYQDMQIDVASSDSSSNQWLLEKVFIRQMNDSSENVLQIEKLDTTLHFNITELGLINNTMEAMTTSELNIYRDRQAKKGANNLTQIEITLYERTSYPFAAYILTLIGISVASRKSREGVGKSIFVGLMACFLYIFFMKMMTVAATNVGLPPIIAVWVPNIIFAIVAIILYFNRMRNEEPLSLGFFKYFWRR